MLFGMNANSSSMRTFTESPRPASELVVDMPIEESFSNVIDVLPYSLTPGFK